MGEETGCNTHLHETCLGNARRIQTVRCRYWTFQDLQSLPGKSRMGRLPEEPRSETINNWFQLLTGFSLQQSWKENSQNDIVVLEYALSLPHPATFVSPKLLLTMVVLYLMSSCVLYIMALAPNHCCIQLFSIFFHVLFSFHCPRLPPKRCQQWGSRVSTNLDGPFNLNELRANVS